MIGLTYLDSIQLIDPVVDSYGAPRIGQVETVPCLFISRTGSAHAANAEGIVSDAELYIDPTHWFVEQNHNRLEEMLVISARFSADSDESWYKIINVRVGEDKLLTNNIDNILVGLKKTTELKYVS